MEIFEIALVLSALLCSLVAGFLFSYAVVVMPGIKNFDDKQFIKTFQVTDRIIQNNNPFFLLIWLGSALAIIICTFFGFNELQGLDFTLLIFSSIGYLIGVQVSTIVIHLPMNNKLQSLNVETMNKKELSQARLEFESRWNKSNAIRTVIACCVSLVLIFLILRQ